MLPVNGGKDLSEPRNRQSQSSWRWERKNLNRQWILMIQKTPKVTLFSCFSSSLLMFTLALISWHDSGLSLSFLLSGCISPLYFSWLLSPLPISPGQISEKHCIRVEPLSQAFSNAVSCPRLLVFGEFPGQYNVSKSERLGKTGYGRYRKWPPTSKNVLWRRLLPMMESRGVFPWRRLRTWQAFSNFHPSSMSWRTYQG